MDCSLPDSSVYRISQARILEWVAISFSRGASWLGDQTCISCIEGGFFPLSHMMSFSSVQFSRSDMSDSLRPHESHHARPPCPSPTPGVYSNSCPSSRWCHPTISSSVVPFSSCSQSVPASGSFSNELTTRSNPNNFPFFSKLKPKFLLMVIETWEYLVISSRPP